MPQDKDQTIKELQEAVHLIERARLDVTGVVLQLRGMSALQLLGLDHLIASTAVDAQESWGYLLGAVKRKLREVQSR